MHTIVLHACTVWHNISTEIYTRPVYACYMLWLVCFQLQLKQLQLKQLLLLVWWSNSVAIVAVAGHIASIDLQRRRANRDGACTPPVYIFLKKNRDGEGCPCPVSRRGPALAEWTRGPTPSAAGWISRTYVAFLGCLFSSTAKLKIFQDFFVTFNLWIYIYNIKYIQNKN